MLQKHPCTLFFLKIHMPPKVAHKTYDNLRGQKSGSLGLRNKNSFFLALWTQTATTKDETLGENATFRFDQQINSRWMSTQRVTGVIVKSLEQSKTNRWASSCHLTLLSARVYEQELDHVAEDWRTTSSMSTRLSPHCQQLCEWSIVLLRAI